VRPEGLGKLEKIHLLENRARLIFGSLNINMKMMGVLIDNYICENNKNYI
jgi:hypothetical protein